MKKTVLLSLAGAIALSCLQLASAKPYRVAVLPSWMDHHLHEYDYAFQEAGMTWTNLSGTVEQMDWLEKSLDDFDLLFGPCLFGYTNDPRGKPVPYDMKKYAPAIRKWVEKGGCLFIVDANYTAPLAWIKSIDPSLEVSMGGCNSGPAIGVEPQDSILFFPKRAEYGFTWGHMTVPDQKKTGWKILSRCGHGEPTLMIKRMGRGIILITSLRSNVPEFVENLRVNQQFLTLGLEVQGCAVPDPVPGTNTFSVTCRNLSDQAMDGELKLILTPLSKGEDGETVASGAPKTYRQRSTIPPGTNGVVRLDCRIAERGLHRVELRLEAGGATGTCFDRDMDLPPLFAVSGPRYRGIVATDRRFDEIKLGTRIFPDGEKLDKLSVQIRIVDDRGKVLGKGEVPAQPGATWSFIPFSRQTKPGTYRIIGELLNFMTSEILATNTASLEVVESVPGLTVFDENRMMMHDGKPFFPLGIYHPAGDQGLTSDFATLADLGFNTIQTFSWAGTRQVDLIHQVGATLLWELLPHRIPALAAAQAANLATHPAPLLYYTMDEPPASHFDLVHAIDKAYRDNDPNRPTYVVSYKPYEFNRNVWLSDVLAPDPYPWNTRSKDNSNIAMVSRWMDRAREASGGTRPYVCVPQAFGKEPPDIWRNMAIQAIAHGASGLIWYAWNEGHGVGMKYNEELRETARLFIAQVKAISPALLSDGTQPRSFTAADYRLHAMVCRDPETRTWYLLAANSSKEPLSVDVPLPEAGRRVTALEDAFGDRTIAVSNGIARIRFGRFESGFFCWGGPKPVLERPATDFAGRDLPPRASGRKLTVVAPGAPLPANGYTNLQMAVEAAKDGDVILVPEGTYEPIVSDNLLVDIVATGAREKTVIDARGRGRCATLTQKPFGDMAYQTNTLLKGFTLRNGDSREDGFRDTLGGGAIGGTLEACFLERNKAVYGGGAAYANLLGCILRGNTAAKNGGAAALSILHGTLAEGNRAGYDGGAFDFCRATLCRVLSNRADRDGGATHFGRNVSCRIEGNLARRNGGGTSYSINRHSLVSRNQTSQGDGGGVFEGETDFCTIVKNTANGKGGGLGGHELAGAGVPRSVRNSIIWDNASRSDRNVTEVYHRMAPEAGCWISHVSTNHVPRGVHTEAPCFLSPGDGDYRLAPNSPCRDRKRPFVPRDTVDPDGNPRVRGGGADAGAYEAVAGDLVLCDYAFGAESPISSKDRQGPLLNKTPRVDPRIEDGAVRMEGDLALSSRATLQSLGSSLSCWSTMVFETDFRAGKAGGPLFAATPSKDQGLWTEVDAASGHLRLVVSIGDPKDGNRFVHESPTGVSDGQWHRLEVQVDRLGGEDGFLKVRLDGKDVPRSTGGTFPRSGFYELPATRIQLGCRDDRRFHGAIRSMKVSVREEPLW